MGDGRPLLAIVTRVHPDRPEMLKTCLESVAAQDDRDFTHVLHRIDPAVYGTGVGNANRALTDVRTIPARYGLVLDDDDMLADGAFVSGLRAQVDAAGDPEIIFCRGYIGTLGVVPSDTNWRKRPVFGDVGSFCYVVRADVWAQHIARFDYPYGGDFQFIQEAYLHTTRHVWWDRVVARTQRGPGRGKGEAELG